MKKNPDDASREPYFPFVRRLAFVQGWSDELLEHALSAHPGKSQAEFAWMLQKAADCLNLGKLRGDTQIGDEGARLLGFDDGQSLQAFELGHPLLSVQLGAIAWLDEVQGRVIARSETEVIIEAENGVRYYGERLPESPQLHELAKIRHGKTIPVVFAEPVRRMRL